LWIELMLWVLVENKLHAQRLLLDHHASTDSSDHVVVATLLPRVDDSQINYVDIGHLRVALFTVLFCFLTFFGTGNIASISSFEISSTYRFLTIFQPWVIALLLIVKLLLPFAIIAVVSNIINQYLIKIPQTASFLMVLMLTNLMALNFFLLVKDSGSWLEIGISIGHYVATKLSLAFHMLLFGFSQLVLRNGVTVV